MLFHRSKGASNLVMMKRKKTSDRQNYGWTDRHRIMFKRNLRLTELQTKLQTDIQTDRQTEVGFDIVFKWVLVFLVLGS